MRHLLILALTVSTLGCSEDPKPAPKPDGKILADTNAIHADVVYGRDNRLDVYQLGDSPWRRVAGATVALMKTSKVSPLGDGYSIATENFGTGYNLCPSEPFRDQGTAAFCSGFLVSEDVVMTAGHCIRTQVDCVNTYIVFDFALNSSTAHTPRELPASKVYRCGTLLKWQMDSNTGADFAVIRLDRAVQGVQPVRLRKSGTAQPGDELVVIGHPVGLPTKVAAEGIVRRIEAGYLVASLDTYGGNSGSAVFNAKTGEVEGILVRGETDFVYNGTCRTSNVCAQDGCRGEDVTRIEFPRNAIGM